MFKRPPQTQEALRDMYCPCMQQKSDFEPLLKTKLNSSGLVFKVSDKGVIKSSISEIEAQSHGVPVISVDRIWTMSGRFGLTLCTQALLLFPRQERTVNDVFALSDVFTAAVTPVRAG